LRELITLVTLPLATRTSCPCVSLAPNAPTHSLHKSLKNSSDNSSAEKIVAAAVGDHFHCH
jgi:hypothetical protein